MLPDYFLETKIGPAFKYHGGKCGLARRIINLLPDHQIYGEGFAGGLNVLLNKFRSPLEVVNDLDPEISYFYRGLQEHGPEIAQRVRETPYSQEVFERARGLQAPLGSVEACLAVLIRRGMSRGGLGNDYTSHYIPKQRNPTQNVDSWKNKPAVVLKVSQRIQGVTIENLDILEFIKKYDRKETTFYLDPPYYPGTRVTLKIYNKEMTPFQHLQLLRLIKECHAGIVLSGYACPIYDQELKSWERREFEVVSNSSQNLNGKSRPKRTEVLWIKHASA